MEQKEMSVQELLQLTADLINEIQVPVLLADQISRPLCQAVANIRTVIDAIENAPEKKPGESDENV